jgi:protein TonB
MAVLLGFVVLFVLLIIGLVQLFKFIINDSEKKIMESGAKEGRELGLLKKYPDVDLNKYSALLLNVGLIVSLGIALMAFEWKTYDDQQLASLGTLEVKEEEVIEIPPTEQKPPPPPKLVQPEIVEVPDEEEIDQDIEVDLNVEVNQQTTVTAPVVVPKKQEVVEEEVVEEIFTVVEQNAEPEGGMDAFYKYLNKALKYPAQARRMGVEGKVYVQFVVEKDGSLTDIKIVKGIGAGCDEEAERVVREAKKWKPGKQRGRPVRQRMVIPIIFKLG